MIEKNCKCNFQRRIEYLDIFRGIGIILMIMGHVVYTGKFEHFIHAFHMPMFFFISGYLYRDKEISIRDFFIKKAKTLLIPYFFYGILQYCFWLLTKWPQMDFQPLWHLFTINTDGLAIAGSLWFLTALFWTDLMFFLIKKYGR